jgi:hypothetical protein
MPMQERRSTHLCTPVQMQGYRSKSTSAPSTSPCAGQCITELQLWPGATMHVTGCGRRHISRHCCLSGSSDARRWPPSVPTSAWLPWKKGTGVRLPLACTAQHGMVWNDDCGTSQWYGRAAPQSRRQRKRRQQPQSRMREFKRHTSAHSGVLNTVSVISAQLSPPSVERYRCTPMAGGLSPAAMSTSPCTRKQSGTG